MQQRKYKERIEKPFYNEGEHELAMYEGTDFTVWGRYPHPYFRDKEAETQTVQATFLKSQSNLAWEDMTLAELQQ